MLDSETGIDCFPRKITKGTFFIYKISDYNKSSKQFNYRCTNYVAPWYTIKCQLQAKGLQWVFSDKI